VLALNVYFLVSRKPKHLQCLGSSSDDEKIIAKQEIDDLFRQATGNRFKVHPAWWIG